MSIEAETRNAAFGRFVRKRRQELGYRQEDLAGRWGKSQSAVSLIEVQGILPKAQDFPSLATALQVSVEMLFVEAGISPEESMDEIILQEGKAIRLIAREGDPGTRLFLTDDVLKLLQIVASMQKVNK